MIVKGAHVRNPLIGAALLVALLVSPWTAASARAQAKGLLRVAPYAGKLVWVIDRAGRTLLVRVVGATEYELNVTNGGAPQTIGVKEITRVYVDGDSVKDGAIIGGLVGLPIGVLSCQGSSDSNCDFITHAFGARSSTAPSGR